MLSVQRVHWFPCCFGSKKTAVGRLLWCMFGECVTGARCALMLSVGLDSLYALRSLRRCASLFSMGLDSLFTICVALGSVLHSFPWG